MLRDLAGSLAAVVVFSLVLFSPGYLVAFCTNVFGFRNMPFSQRSLWAVASSFCVSPIAAHLAGRAYGLTGICWLFGVVGVAILPLLLRRSGLSDWPYRDRLISAGVVAGWTVFVLLMLVDLQIGHKLYYSVVMADQSYRIAFTDAVVRTGIPPANPLYFAGSPAPMRYYYFWYVLCAAVVKLGHVSARQSFIASSVWAGFGLIAAVRLYASAFFRWTRKTTWIALALLLVTGADLLPALGNLFLQSSVNGDTEWWSVDPIDAWPDSLLWVPHHVASVLCCLFAFLLLWRLLHSEKRENQFTTLMLAGAACASAFGLSVYVTLGFALLMLVWLCRCYLRRDPFRQPWLTRLIITACLSLILLIPFLKELLSWSAHSASNEAIATPTAKHLLWFSVRPMIDSGLITSLPAFATWNHSHPVLFDQAVRLLLLIPGLAMELGLYGAVLFFLLQALRRKEAVPRDEARDAALFLCIAGLLLTMFVSSSVISNNDFGYRAVMLPQFFLTLLTADVLHSWWTSANQPSVRPTVFRRRLVMSLLVLGIAGSVYWAVLLRGWLPIETAQASGGFQESPADAFQVREAFGRLNRVSSTNAVVAFRDMDLDAERRDMEVMTPTEYFQRMLVMDAGRQLLNAEPKCATHFGGDPTACAKIKKNMLELYATPSPSKAWAQDYCQQLGVHYLLLTIRDPAWTHPSGWSASLPVVVEEPRLKIMQCDFSLTR